DVSSARTDADNRFLDARRAHLDADPPVGFDGDVLPAGGGDHEELGTGSHAGVDDRPGEATEAVATGLGLAAVGIPELHAHVGAVAPGRDPDEAVRSDAAVPIAQLPGALGVDALTPVEVEQDQEVVPEPVVLDEPHG